LAARLFVIPGSHPSLAARLMLERKGVEYKRVDLVPVVSKGVLRAARFPGVTVPALKLDGRRVQGTRAIAETLDQLNPAPPLWPADPEKRAKVDELERWADGKLQDIPRRTLWWALRRDKSPLGSYSEGARLGVPVGLAVKTAGPIVALSARFNESTDDQVRQELADLPGALDRVDAAIAEGTIGGEEPNVADYQVAPSLRLVMTFEDLRPKIESRPCGDLALRLVPEYPGRIPAGTLPADWL
jgi:glutathione S-transferase